jgi:hypothetical protein
MAELPERDAALLLDMLFAARDAQAFVEGLDETGFLASPLHQNATIRSLEVIGEAAGQGLGRHTDRPSRNPVARDNGHATPSYPRLCRSSSRSCVARAR